MESLIPAMAPAAGERLKRFVGDSVVFRIADQQDRRPSPGWRALLRTNLGRGQALRQEIVEAHARGLAPAGASWRDIPMNPSGNGWELELPLAEPGFFQAKAYLVDSRQWQHWPAGDNVGISVHPDRYRAGNIVYGAFARMFGPTRTAAGKREEQQAPAVAALDQAGYVVIPPSGKLRDLKACLPHIFDTLGCRILQLLPINPTPTTYARFGRYGSPYAALDLTAIDPALVVFDKRTTGIDQFQELTYAVHLHGGRVFLDIVINHTGWGSVLQENRPEWFLRQPDGAFASPGAWGTVWEDLVELRHVNVALWDELAEMFLTWCRRGVDGFRCDAGYKVPVAAWQYIVARVQQHFPETIFFLEGLGGAWETTDELLTHGGMQWAYSELFQNYSGQEVSQYLDYSLRQCERTGLLLHYSETHDNPRLAARGRAWSVLRNRLCALASVSGAFGFTCGVEWLATESIRVHESHGMNWGQSDNLVAELAALDRLLAEHPCFFDGAKLRRLSRPGEPVLALHRQSEEGLDEVLVLVNTDADRAHDLSLAEIPALPRWTDLLGQAPPPVREAPDRRQTVHMSPGAAYCLSPALAPVGMHGRQYRGARARAAWALTLVAKVLPVERIGKVDWRRLAQAVDRAPADFLARVASLDPAAPPADLAAHLDATEPPSPYPKVVEWTLPDRARVRTIPPGHWLLVRDNNPFRARLNRYPEQIESIVAAGAWLACFPPGLEPGDASLDLERYTQDPARVPNGVPPEARVQATLRFLPDVPAPPSSDALPLPTGLVLLTNGRGGMARMRVDLGSVLSKYDCVLGANLHPDLPVDRHVFAKRIRVWVNADGFISALDYRNLSRFVPGPPATWDFLAPAGDGRSVEIKLAAEMVEGQNTVRFQFSRPTAAQAKGIQLPPEAEVRLTVRVDIEDRNFHAETKHNGGADHHFAAHTRARESAPGAPETGFEFQPAPDRGLRVFTDAGRYHPQPEWSFNLPHPVEQSRGQEPAGDAFSPGWFELPLPKGAMAGLVVTAEPGPALPAPQSNSSGATTSETKTVAADDWFGQRLLASTRAFIVRRGTGKTIIAGYPWFLDWGRDSLICARGLIAAGLLREVRDLLITFGRFEQAGTLPNTIHGENVSNRSTSDAPLWFALACEEMAAALSGREDFYAVVVDESGRTIRGVLQSIALNYLQGTPNGIRVDPGSGLVWSPSHFTWMDTNYPAGTPREGYPVEIQALWIRLLQQLERLGGPHQRQWAAAAALAADSLQRFWLDRHGWFADVLRAPSGCPADRAAVDDALRSNCLFLVTLGFASGQRARQCVDAALRHLAVPGALRSLAPLPVTLPLPIRAADGRLLNDPAAPYWGRYEGDEDNRRKPAYHNGTAWTWTFPVLCEALAKAWDNSPEARAAARSYLGSAATLLAQGCLGHLPEILDGDAPHTQRGCDAQAWAATEALRVWLLLR